MTLSMGATAVLEMAAAIPPAKKSLAKEIAVSDIFGCCQTPFSYFRQWGLPVELKWPTSIWRRGDLRRLSARKPVNFYTRVSLAGRGSSGRG